MKIFDNSFRGPKTELSTLNTDTQTVVMILAMINKTIKLGTSLVIFNFWALWFTVSSWRMLNHTDKNKVIGMIARVLVNLTVTALSRVSVPKFHKLSQVEAAAVTDEVSLTAVPAKIPKASGPWVMPK